MARTDVDIGEAHSVTALSGLRQIGFSPDALALARVFRGMTKRELALEVGISSNYAGEIENGKRLPGDRLVVAFAAALGFPETFLLRRAPAQPPADVLHFRAKARMPKQLREGLRARGSLFAVLGTAIREHCDLPPDAFPQVCARSASEIETAAERARFAWGLDTIGPLANVTRILERAGALVANFSNADARAEAFSWRHLGAPYVLYNRDIGSPSRLRLTLAHEAGHLVLHRDRKTGDSALEVEAFRFAGALLFPRAAFHREFPRARYFPWTALLGLKRRWGMSVQAMVRRAYDLGVIDEATYRRYCIRISQLGQRTDEAGEAATIEAPELLPSVLSALRGIKKLSLGALAPEALLQPVVADIAGVELEEPLPPTVLRLHRPEE